MKLSDIVHKVEDFAKKVGEDEGGKALVDIFHGLIQFIEAKAEGVLVASRPVNAKTLLQLHEEETARAVASVGEKL